MGFGERLGAAFRAFFSLLSSGTLPPDVGGTIRDTAASGQPAVVPPSAPPDEIAPAPSVTAADGAVQILALLQRDARLLDFLMEDLAGYPDAQVGAAAREVQAGARRALLQYLEVEPVLDGTEDQAVTLPSVDADLVKIVGRAVAATPVRGTLRHRGWRSARVQLPALPPASARQVIAQAEVEVA
jgi:hypothetical protein